MAKIYIDPGHNNSGADTGAVGFGLKEQDITVQIGLMLKNMLSANGQTVKMSRENIYDTVAETLNGSLAYRYSSANNWGADIFISIHCNAANTKAYGCETYTTGSTNGTILANKIQPHLVAETGRYNRGVKTASFAVIRHTNMPAVLVETAFIDNYEDNQFLASDNGKKACATAICKGICDYLGIEYNLNTESEDIDMDKYNELKEMIQDVQNENNRQNGIINAVGQDISNLNKAVQPMIYNYIDENMPEWARASVKKAVDNGIIVGGDNGLGLTETDLKCIVREDRAGVYGE